METNGSYACPVCTDRFLEAAICRAHIVGCLALFAARMRANDGARHPCPLCRALKPGAEMLGHLDKCAEYFRRRKDGEELPRFPIWELIYTTRHSDDMDGVESDDDGTDDDSDGSECEDNSSIKFEPWTPPGSPPPVPTTPPGAPPSLAASPAPTSNSSPAPTLILTPPPLSSPTSTPRPDLTERDVTDWLDRQTIETLRRLGNKIKTKIFLTELAQEMTRKRKRTDDDDDEDEDLIHTATRTIKKIKF